MLQVRMGQKLYIRAQYEMIAIGGANPLQSQCSMLQEIIPTGMYGVQRGVIYNRPNTNPASNFAPLVVGYAPPTSPTPTCAFFVMTLEDLPPLLAHVTERVQEAMDYINQKHDIWQHTHE